MPGRWNLGLMAFNAMESVIYWASWAFLWLAINVMRWFSGKWRWKAVIWFSRRRYILPAVLILWAVLGFYVGVTLRVPYYVTDRLVQCFEVLGIVFFVWAKFPIILKSGVTVNPSGLCKQSFSLHIFKEVHSIEEIRAVKKDLHCAIRKLRFCDVDHVRLTTPNGALSSRLATNGKFVLEAQKKAGGTLTIVDIHPQKMKTYQQLACLSFLHNNQTWKKLSSVQAKMAYLRGLDVRGITICLPAREIVNVTNFR